MDKKEEEFLQKLRSTFKIEAEEHLRSISAELIGLESDPTVQGRGDALQTIYRAAHSLKGAARAVNLRDVESICQMLESTFALLKNEELSPSPELFDTLHHTIDELFRLVSEPDGPGATDVVNALSRLIQGQPPTEKRASTVTPELPQEAIREAAIESSQQEGPPPEACDVVSLTSPSEHFEPERSVWQTATRHPAQADTVRISIKKLDALLFQVEEMVSVKMSATQRISDLRDVSIILDSWGKAWRTLFPDVRNARQYMGSAIQNEVTVKLAPEFDKILDFLDTNQDYWQAIEGKITSLTKSAEGESRSLNSMVDDLLEDMKNLLMLPFSTLLEIFPKLVRDLSRDKGKDVGLVVQGGDIEIDRRILEEMKDPLIHLVRNSVDHGIELPIERSGLNKPTNGTLTISISQPSSNRIEILVSDDGRGIDVEKVRRAAVSKRMLSEREARALSEQEVLVLIFRSEVSTADIITDLSGRGLGLAIVQEKVDKLGGHITVESEPFRNTSFRISLPVTLATFRGILTRVSDRLFVIPTSGVERVLRVKKETIKTVENRYTIVLNGRVLLFVRMADFLELASQPDGEQSDLIPTVVVTHGKKVVAFGVDDVVSEQEVLIKGLGKQLSRVRNVGGATVLASGEVVTILNVSDLVKSALKTPGSAPRPSVYTEVVDQKPRRILLAEDSITSRTLLKNILESAGYEVYTTVDGSEAWTALKTQDFDLVVSDVQMPRMTGFELTSRMRNDQKLSEIPVVLVTSLESREDRETGVDVGANAYIIKSSFDQSNLLEVVSRLV
jgi:two-component system, chemotaxis family, sensor kinase CheA